MLRHIVEDATLLPEANTKSGYYSESSMHKLRTIMKQKLAVLREGRIPRDTEFVQMLQQLQSNNDLLSDDDDDD